MLLFECLDGHIYDMFTSNKLKNFVCEGGAKTGKGNRFLDAIAKRKAASNIRKFHLFCGVLRTL